MSIICLINSLLKWSITRTIHKVVDTFKNAIKNALHSNYRYGPREITLEKFRGIWFTCVLPPKTIDKSRPW